MIRYYRGTGQPVPNVTVALQGSSPQSVTSAADGHYALGGVAETGWRVSPRKTGDQRNAVSALDAAYVLQAVAGTRTLDARQTLAGDVTGDGTLSALDATRILQRVVGVIGQFPAAQLCGSDWLFVPVPASAPNQSMTAPAFSAGTCEPGAILFNPLAGDVAGQDFQALLIGDVTGNWQ